MTIMSRIEALERRAAVINTASTIRSARLSPTPWPDAAALLTDSVLPGVIGRIARARLRVVTRGC